MRRPLGPRIGALRACPGMTVEGQRMGFPSVLWGSHLWGSHGTGAGAAQEVRVHIVQQRAARSEEHTSELQSLMRISYAVFCLKKKKTPHELKIHTRHET